MPMPPGLAAYMAKKKAGGSSSSSTNGPIATGNSSSASPKANMQAAAQIRVAEMAEGLRPNYSPPSGKKFAAKKKVKK